MHKKNCLTCKHSRSDIGWSICHQIHCEIQNTEWWDNHLSQKQEDIIRRVGCASWESNE